MFGPSLGDVPVPVSIALVLHDEDKVKPRQDGRLQLDVLSGRLQVIIPAPRKIEAQAPQLIGSSQRHNTLTVPAQSPILAMLEH